MSQLRALAIKLSDAQWEGHSFNCLPMPSEKDVLQVTVGDQDEIPVYITITETQMLCIAYFQLKAHGNMNIVHAPRV